MSRAARFAAVGGVVAGAALLLLLGGNAPLGSSTLPTPPSPVAYLGVECTTVPGGLAVVLGGVTVGTTTYGPEDGDLTGGSCVVITPPGLSPSVIARCAVTGPSTATIYATTPLALGVAIGGPTTWCTRVETLHADPDP